MRLTQILLAAGAALTSWSAMAQQYPARPVQFVVPYAAGGNGDIVARLVGQRLATALAQPVLIDNRPGAGGNIGADYAARATADGHTIMLTSNSHTINMSLYKSLTYDINRDFAAVSMVSSAPLALIVHPAVPAKNLKELIALAKASPGQLHYASPGSGSGAHLTAELLKASAGIDLVHVPYKGAPQANTDLVAGQVQLMFNAPSTAMNLIQGGKVRGIAVSTGKRTPLAPGLPTLAESGLPGIESSIWQGILVPGKTPAAIVTRLNREIAGILDKTELKEQFFRQGVDPESSTPEQMAAYMKADVEKWARIIRLSGATVD